MKRTYTSLFIISLVAVFVTGIYFTVHAQTIAPSGTLQVTKTAYDDFFITSSSPAPQPPPPPTTPPPAPDTVFWFLISGYPSPTNPWISVGTQAAGSPPGSGQSHMTMAAGSYDIFEQYDDQDWVLTSVDCGEGSTPMPGIGAINVTVPEGDQVDCTFKNDYIAIGQVKMVVNAIGSDGDFKLKLTHSNEPKTGFSCSNNSCITDPNGTASGCTATGDSCTTPSPDTTNDKNITIKTVNGLGEKTVDLHVDTTIADGAYNLIPDSLKKDWTIDSVSCQRSDATEVGVVDSIANSISAVTIQPHKTTTCTFNVHQKPGTLDIITTLSVPTVSGTSPGEITDIQTNTPDKQPQFLYQLGGLLSQPNGNTNIGAGGALYYPLPYYLQLIVNTVALNDTDTVPRLALDTTKPWAYGKQSVTVSSGVYYIQQTSPSGWQPSSVTCVQVYKDGQTLYEPPLPPGATPPTSPPTPPAQPAVGDRIYIDEKGQWVQKCTNNKDPHDSANPGNCCSITNSTYYKDNTHVMASTTPPPPPASPPLFQYGIPESCSFGSVNPALNQLNIPLSSTSIAAVPIAPGGRTICIFNLKKPATSGSGSRPGGGSNTIETPRGPGQAQ